MKNIKISLNRYRLTPQRLVVVLLFVAIFAMAIGETKDPDMWWHLASGRYMWEHGIIPREDVFSYTRAGVRWYTHEWLTELIMYGLYRWGGEAALIFAAAVVVTATIILMYNQCHGRPYVAAFIVVLGAAAAKVTWGARPQMVTFLFATILMCLIERYREGNSRVLWAFPVLMALWVNLHAGFFLGLGLLGAILIGDCVALLFNISSSRTLSPPALRSLFISLLISVAATLINPNTYHMLTYPFGTLGSSAMQTYIQEWASPDFHLIDFWPFAVLLLGGALLMVVRRRTVDITDLLLFFGFGLTGLMSARHISLFAVVSVPIVSRSFDKVVLPSSRRNLPVLNWTLSLLALIAVAARFVVIVNNNQDYKMTHYPQAAIDYIQSHEMASLRMYNSYGWGGYLIWNGLPVFMDGRADVYGDAFIEEYLLTYYAHPDWRSALQKYNVDYVLIRTQSSLAAVLAETSEWEKVYEDDVAVIYTQN